MRICFCSQNSLSPNLGAPRVLIGLADEMSRIGWDCHLHDPSSMRAALGLGHEAPIGYNDLLLAFLKANAEQYDVVDYDYACLPFPRGTFPARPLFVARAVLLYDYLLKIKLPCLETFLQQTKSLLTNRHGKYRQEVIKQVANGRITNSEADIVNVANHRDKAELVSAGIAEKKVVVIPYGLSNQEVGMLSHANRSLTENPVVAFIGTFDSRKGGADMPRIFQLIRKKTPKCRFKLLGTAGPHQSIQRVLSFFPSDLRSSIDVIPRFDRDALPGLLDHCSAGIFPSYFEGFGFGVLEMLAAGLPVVAYDAPGPSDILSPDCLVERGNVTALANKVVELISNSNDLDQAKQSARARARSFSWKEAARITSECYSLHQANTSPGACSL